MKSGYSASRTHASLFAPTKPPKPIDIAPAINSASPPSTTSLALPKVERPAVSAKGTVRPSDKPRIASEMSLGPMLILEAWCFDARSSLVCSELVCDSRSLSCVSCCIVPRVPVSVISVVVSESFLVGVCPSFVSGTAAITEDKAPRVPPCVGDRDARMISSLFHEDLLAKEKEKERKRGIL